MADQPGTIWESDNEATLLESRLAGFWNPDYLKHVIAPLLNLKSGARVLDVGSGTGCLTLLFARLFPDSQIVGVDITPTLVRDAGAQAGALGVSNVEFREADALHLPFANGEFDSVVCQTLLAFVADPRGVVREMSRVLRKGGTFMAAEYHTVNAEFPIDRERMDLTDEQAAESAKYTRMLIKGFHDSGQGDLRIGGKIPFFGLEAGLEIVDVRINDRVVHAFPPYANPAQHAARAEARALVATYADAQWRAWFANAITAGGGCASDLDRFLSFLSDTQRKALSSEPTPDYPFVWLINPVLLVTIGRKQ